MSADQAYRFYLDLGYEPYQAAAIVGGLQQESGRSLDPAALGDQGTAFGVAQWRGPRLDALRSFAAARGADPADLGTQLAFVDHELRTSESRAGEALRASRSAEDAARAFISYERPAGWSWENPAGGHGFENRLANAVALLGEAPAGPRMSNTPLPAPAPVPPNMPPPMKPGPSPISGMLMAMAPRAAAPAPAQEPEPQRQESAPAMPVQMPRRDFAVPDPRAVSTTPDPLPELQAPILLAQAAPGMMPTGRARAPALRSRGGSVVR